MRFLGVFRAISWKFLFTFFCDGWKILVVVGIFYEIAMNYYAVFIAIIRNHLKTLFGLFLIYIHRLYLFKATQKIMPYLCASL